VPRFTRYGPVVPDALVQALEDDHVVIFCGAGISMGAGLPDFKGLVQHCYAELNLVPPNPKSTDWLWLDRLLGILEFRSPSGDLRRIVAKRLSQAPTDLALHKAILRLARLNSVRGLRLVTTNFDTYFEQAQNELVFGRDLHSGPVLPIPRNDRIVSWRSIVYLHGRLAPAAESNDHLVLTSADFGRAYMTEAWAARFVTRLFADFTVLFIGYSLNDPVLRYMTDAFAAEKSQARSSSRRGSAYIFLEYSGRKPPDPSPYRDRNLEPIFYNQERKHLRLKQTLLAWANARQDYLLSAGAIIERAGANEPQALDPSDVDNVMWAIVGRPKDGGYGAKVFAQLEKRPPIAWLFEIERRETTELAAWAEDNKRASAAGEDSLPSPILHLELLTTVQNEAGQPPLTRTASELARWLLRHLETLELVNWVIDKLARNSRLHLQFRRKIRERLINGKPLLPGFALFWHIVSAEGPWNRAGISNFAWADVLRQLQASSDTDWFREEFLMLLRPYLHLSTAFSPRLGGNTDPIGQSIDSVVEATVRLVGHDNLQSIVEAIDCLSDADRFLARFPTHLTELLEKALDLYAIVGRAGENWDQSVLDRPSIQPHSQNRGFREWTMLFDLLWRSWRRIDHISAAQSRALVHHWRVLPYFAFRRLAIAAMTVSPNFTSAEKAEVLLNA
jgi:SIR2-like domain